MKCVNKCVDKTIITFPQTPLWCLKIGQNAYDLYYSVQEDTKYVPQNPISLRWALNSLAEAKYLGEAIEEAFQDTLLLLVKEEDNIEASAVPNWIVKKAI